MCAILERAALVALAFATLTACTTAQEMRRPNGDIQYVIGCGAGTGWNVCYARANELCPSGYNTLAEDAGFNRKELRIACRAEQRRQRGPNE
ncbi:hypothetical protein QF025_006974 [Paraburkholderia graminis]|uniref:Lipoprotein n=1 Tax=Paraburkholderia graminis TaxID=60548 RepID=A0ABD5CSY5_9BURK|nr:hypothetical protein [Paraburkholderia graminis]